MYLHEMNTAMGHAKGICPIECGHSMFVRGIAISIISRAGEGHDQRRGRGGEAAIAQLAIAVHAPTLEQAGGCQSAGMSIASCNRRGSTGQERPAKWISSLLVTSNSCRVSHHIRKT